MACLSGGDGTQTAPHARTHRHFSGHQHLCRRRLVRAERPLLGLRAPRTTRVTGKVIFDRRDVLGLPADALGRCRGGSVSMVFQEPGLAFDPVDAVDARTARARALEMLECVQIPQAARRLDAYPNELSGGMRQRAMIALALACRPRLLLADEPTTALDATVQIQILLLVRELQRETGMAIIFVSHDIGAAIEVADRIAVMYAGRIVEENAVAALVGGPMHHDTAGLLASTPVPGCAFAPRCAAAIARCRVDRPPLVRDGPQALACWRPVAARDVVARPDEARAHVAPANQPGRGGPPAGT